LLNKSRQTANIVLLLSAYIPLYLTIIIQNSFSLWNELNIKFEINISDLLNFKKIMNNIDNVLTYPETWIILMFILSIIILLCFLFWMLKNTYNTNSSLSYNVKVIKVEDKNHEYLTSYIAIYILPFITLDLTSYSGLTQFVFLFFFIGYIYLKYEMIYVNPILNIFFGLNTYDVQYKVEDNDNTYNTVVLSKKDKKTLLKGKIKVRGSSGILIDLEKK
jgi:hypothetical protein